MPAIEKPKQLSEWGISCDECGNTHGTSWPSHTDATGSAYKAGWICFGKVWICVRCRTRAEDAAQLQPLTRPERAS